MDQACSRERLVGGVDHRIVGGEAGAAVADLGVTPRPFLRMSDSALEPGHHAEGGAVEDREPVSPTEEACQKDRAGDPDAVDDPADARPEHQRPEEAEVDAKQR